MNGGERIHTLLFAVAGRTSKGDRERLAVHQDLALDLSHVLSAGEDVHEGSLSRSTRPHQSGQLSSLAVSRNVVEKVDVFADSLRVQSTQSQLQGAGPTLES